MKTSRIMLTLGAVAVVGYAGVHALRGSSDAETAINPGLIENRAWLEREPQAPTETIHVFFALSRQASGVFFQGSSWQGRFERFAYERKNNEVRLVFPQTNNKAKFTYKITKCNEREGFDLCLDLDKNPWEGGPKRYYGATEESRMPAAARDLAHEAMKQ